MRRPREVVLEKDQRPQNFAIDRLGEGWPPEQIAGWLKTGAERALRTPDSGTIYAFTYRASQKAAGLWRYLGRNLARHRKRRKPAKARPARDMVKDRV